MYPQNFTSLNVRPWTRLFNTNASSKWLGRRDLAAMSLRPKASRDKATWGESAGDAPAKRPVSGQKATAQLWLSKWNKFRENAQR